MDEPVVTPAVAATANTNAEDVNQQRVQADVMVLLDKMKLVLPFIVLFTLKLIVDNLVPFALVVCTSYSIFRVKCGFNMQMSLKKKATATAIVNLLLLCIFLSFTTIQFIHMFDMPSELNSRMLLTYALYNRKPVSFLNTVWGCIIIDSLAQIFCLAVKLIVCLAIGSHDFNWSNIKSVFSLDILRLSSTSTRTMHSTSSRAHNTSNSGATIGGIISVQDLEGGGDMATTGTNGSSATSGSIYSQLVSNFNSSHGNLFGLARRQNTPAVANSGDHSNSNSSGHIPHGQSISLNTPYAADNTTTNGVDDDSSSTDIPASQEAAEYLRRLRLCTLIDIISQVYRTLLPLPVWVVYFKGDSDSYSAAVFPLLYLTIKLVDLGWKMRGMWQAIFAYFTKALEFGHYSTPEELGTGEAISLSTPCHDCPICFDEPTVPVSLDCKHMFCEMCISEWLDKEKTCPVCRAEVKPVRPLVGDLKEECASYAPIVI